VGKIVETLKAKAKALAPAVLLVGAAFAQTTTTTPSAPDPSTFDAASIASNVLQYLGVIGAAGVGVLAASIGLSAAYKYARRFLRG